VAGLGCTVEDKLWSDLVECVPDRPRVGYVAGLPAAVFGVGEVGTEGRSEDALAPGDEDAGYVTDHDATTSSPIRSSSVGSYFRSRYIRR